MALYHFSVRHVSRGKGQMVVASAAYISGQKIYDGYYNKIHDYTSKSGVVFTEILTPEYVPERLTDRETLWNEVEHVERNNKAQLAYSFDIALQNELTLEENIKLAKEFCQEQFVARGMIVDLAVHEGKSENEEEPDNPHFHVLAPIRPFTEEGIWGNKQRREYILDEDGNRVKTAADYIGPISKDKTSCLYRKYPEPFGNCVGIKKFNFRRYSIGVLSCLLSNKNSS